MRKRTVRDGFLKTKHAVSFDHPGPMRPQQVEALKDIEIDLLREPQPVSEKQAQDMARIGKEMARSDPEEGESGQLKNIRAAIAMMHEKREQEYLEMATNIDENVVRIDAPPPPSIWTAEFLEWPHIVKAVPHNSIVEAVSEDTDEDIKRAIGIVFKHTKEDQWENENVIKMVASTLINLKKSPQSPK